MRVVCLEPVTCSICRQPREMAPPRPWHDVLFGVLVCPRCDRPPVSLHKG